MKLFVTGISTDVGKTIASSIIVEALQADYWKPIQSGDLDFSDTHKVQSFISNKKSRFFPNSYALQTPASPHFSAELEGVTISCDNIKEPQTANHLVIEGAGGVLVPLNETDSIIDLIQPDYKIILVCRNYLGSINHSLLTIEALRNRNLSVSGIIFSGERNQGSESIILKRTGVKCIGSIEQEPFFDKNVILKYADLFRENLIALENK